MARGTPLALLRYMLQAEVGDALTLINTDITATYNQVLANMQAWLAVGYDWPNLQVRYDVTVNPQVRYLSLPNINYERAPRVYVKWSTTWKPLEIGIDDEELNTTDSDIGSQNDPIQKWALANQAEVVPPLTAPNQAISGVGLTGIYQYAVTYVSAFGETSVGPSVTTANLANQGISLTNIPIAPQVVMQQGLGGTNVSVVTARNIYRTKTGGSTFFFLKTIADNTTTTATDVAADTTLGAAPPTYNTAEVTLFEIWPIPASSQTVRFTGQRNISPLIADTDTADLDDLMIVLFSAAEILTRNKQQDAPLKLQKAQSRLNYVRAAYPRRTSHVVFGGGQEPEIKKKVVPMIIIASH